MEEILDLFDGNDTTLYQDSIMDNEEPKEYYIGKAEFILKQLDNNINYFEFLKVIMKKYHELNDKQKKELIEFMNIPEKVKIVEKIKTVYKEKKSKPKINNYDDY